MISPLVSVIVLNFNGKQHLPVCLTALCNQTYTPIEILLVDNGSTDGSLDLVHENFRGVRTLALRENLGFCGGNNAGIRQARGEYIALLNNDTEADDRWIAESVFALEANPEAGFTASRIRLFDRRDRLDTAGDLYFRTGYPGKRGFLLPDGPEFDKPEWVFGSCAGAAVYRRTMLDEIGLLDEDFFSYIEDTDLSFRAQLAGYRCLYVPTAVIYHKVGATAGQDSPLRQLWSHRNHWYTLIKNLPGALILEYAPQIIIAEVLVFYSAVRKQRLRVFLKARVEVLRNLSRMISKRRKVQKLRKVSSAYIDSLIRKDWITFRRAEKERISQEKTAPANY